MKLSSLLRSLKARRAESRRRARPRLLFAHRCIASVEALEARRLLAASWERIEPLGSLMFQSDISGEIGAPVSFFSDGFESGSLGPQWTTTSSTAHGRVDVTDLRGTPASSGAFHLTMDTTLIGPNNLNEAVLTVDLSGVNDAELRFSHKDVGDEDHALPTTFVGSVFGDGISISQDGTTWHRLTALNNGNSPNGVYTEFTFDLDAKAAAAGIGLGSQFQIKFQQYDNFPFNSDGRAFDDVRITTAGPLSATTTTFLEADQTLTVVATPEDAAATLTVTVRDPSSAVLASATASGPGEIVVLETLGIADAGDYSIEITGDAATQYDLSLFRNATVEVVDSGDGNEHDASGSFVSLGSGRFGIVGEFTAANGEDDHERAVVWGIQPTSGAILKIDPRSGAVMGSFPAPDALTAAHRINGLTIAEEGSTLLYVNGGTNGTDLYRLDPNDGTILSVESLPTNGFAGFRGGLSFESGAPDSIFAIDNGGPVDRQAGFGGPISDFIPSGANAPGALGGDDNGRLFLIRNNQIQEFSPTVANSQLNAFPLPAGASGGLGLAFDGVHLYLSDASGNLFTLDPDSGAVLQQVTVAGGFLSGLGARLLPASSLLPNGGYSPPPLPDLYGDPGEPERFPDGPGAAAQAAAPNELLVNGSFETGDFTGWTTVTTRPPFRPWAVTPGGQGGGFGMLQTQPQDGNYVAWNGFDGFGPMEFRMFQDVTIAAGASATLTWMDRVQWNFTEGSFASLPRRYDVDILDPATNSLLQNVYSFSTGTQSTSPTGNTNWQTHSVDVSAFAGQSVRLMFREQIPQFRTGPGQIEFDAISLTAGAVVAADPDVDEYLLDLTGKAGQPLDIAFWGAAAGSGESYDQQLTQQNNVSYPRVLQFDFANTPAPIGDAILTIDAVADLDGSNEYLALNAEGIFNQNLFISGGLQQQPVSTTVTIPKSVLAQLAADGTISFTVTPSAGVHYLGSPNVLTLDLSYEAGSDQATLELLDTDGTTVLATGVPGPDNFALGIHGFAVPADGVYTVRVSGEGGKYGIAVTDSLVFDSEPNAPNDALLRSLDGAEGALGFLSEGSSAGDVDLSLITSFESLSFPTDSTFIPPDPILAAGPQSVITMVNTDIAIHNKTTGAVIAKADLDGGGGFWGTNSTVFDPWIVFDHDSERFFAMGIDRSTFAGGSSRVYLAVSTDSTPGNLGSDWNKYVINRTGTHRFTGGSTFPDYPKLGVDDDAVYITANDFGILGGGFSHVSLFAIAKAPLLSGGPANIVYDESINNAFSVHPVVNYDSGTPMRFAEAVGSTGIRLHTLADVLTAPARTVTTVSVPTFAFPNDVPQQGGPPLDSVSQRIMSGIVRDGSLWTAHAIRDPAVDTETVVRWYEFDVNGPSPSLVQQGNVDPGPGIHTWIPHVNVDQDGDMAIAFSLSGPTQFASIGYTGRLASDPPGTTRPVETARAGEGPYSLFDGIGRNRWGDYSGLALDPDGDTFWLYNEFAATGNDWGTFVGAFRVEGSQASLDRDTYTVQLSSGEQIGLSTSTPFDAGTDAVNLLDPSIEILDPNGNSVAFDSNSAGDGKNAAIPSFTATIPGTYRVIVAGETAETGEYVLSVNWAPAVEHLALSSDQILEGESVALAGVYSDQNRDGAHTLVVDWDDPNNADDSTFALPGISALSVGDVFHSSIDGAALEITAVDLLLSQVSFAVTGHQYLDDGLAPGNGTAADRSTVTVTVTDDLGLFSAPLVREAMVNGDFETGDLTGWTVSGTGSGNWIINDGSINPPGPGGPLPPIDGNFDAVSVATGRSTAILSELITLPTTVSSAVLSWSDRIRNHAGNFADPVQEWRVLVLDDGGSLIQEVYSTGRGDAPQQVGPNDRSFDLTSLFQTLAGQTVQIRFEQQELFYYFDVALDDVSLKIDSTPSVLVQNARPELVLDPAVPVAENSTFHLTGTLTDQGLLDQHDLVIEWADPNNPDASTFSLPASRTLSVGDTFSSTTDSGVLEITAVDLSSGTVSFDVMHRYADDGVAPGNGTPSDHSTVTVTVNDDDGTRYADFTDAAGLELNGDATTTLTTDGTVLRLASAATFDVGSAFSLLPINAADGFNTNFSFRIGNAGGVSDGVDRGADGLTFTLQTQGPEALGNHGGGLGYGGIAPSVAVEFDTWRGVGETSSNHLGVNVNGNMVSLVTVDEPTNKWDNGGIYYVWIDYDGAELQVRVATTDARPAAANLGLPIDLSAVLGQDLATVGFTAATGGAFGNHDILSWQLNDPAVEQVDAAVVNVAPEIRSLSASATMDDVAAPGGDVSLTGSFSDPGLLDHHDVTIDWNDGSINSAFDLGATADLTVGDVFLSTSGDGAILAISEVVAATGDVSFSVTAHQFATGGIFDVSVTVEDDDAGSGTHATLAWVTGMRIEQGVLQIVGTNGDDHVTVNQQGNGRIKVHADFLQDSNFETFDVADVDEILAYLFAGDDIFTIAGNVDRPAVVHGGDGNDRLNGGGGDAVLLGEDGDDLLTGGTASDLLLGGFGSDRLVGGSRDDVLIGGSTAAEDAALFALLAVWNSDGSYDDRAGAVDALLTVTEDGRQDRLTGSSGRDLFYEGVGDLLSDIKETGEVEAAM